MVYEFKAPLKRQPLFFEANESQTVFMLSSPEDCKYVNLNKGTPAHLEEFELDNDISNIKEITYDHED